MLQPCQALLRKCEPETTCVLISLAPAFFPWTIYSNSLSGAINALPLTEADSPGFSQAIAGNFDLHLPSYESLWELVLVYCSRGLVARKMQSFHAARFISEFESVSIFDCCCLCWPIWPQNVYIPDSVQRPIRASKVVAAVNRPILSNRLRVQPSTRAKSWVHQVRKMNLNR